MNTISHQSQTQKLRVLKALGTIGMAATLLFFTGCEDNTTAPQTAQNSSVGASSTTLSSSILASSQSVACTEMVTGAKAYTGALKIQEKKLDSLNVGYAYYGDSAYTYINLDSGKAVASTSPYHLKINGSKILIDTTVGKATVVTGEYNEIGQAPVNTTPDQASVAWGSYNPTTHGQDIKANSWALIKANDAATGATKWYKFWVTLFDASQASTTKKAIYSVKWAYIDAPAPTQIAEYAEQSGIQVVKNLATGNTYYGENFFTYFNFTEKRVANSTEIAAGKWDLAFNGTNIFPNDKGGVQLLSQDFMALSSAPNCGYKAQLDKSGVDKWYAYNANGQHEISIVAGKSLVVLNHDGSFTKLQLNGYYKDGALIGTGTYYQFQYKTSLTGKF